MRGSDKNTMLRRRDAAGGEMEMLAKIMNDPNPTHHEVADYIEKLGKKQHIPKHIAEALIDQVPSEPAALKQWARGMFAMVMQQGIHAHAAYPRELYPSLQEEPEGQPAPTAPGTPTIQ